MGTLYVKYAYNHFGLFYCLVTGLLTTGFLLLEYQICNNKLHFFLFVCYGTCVM